MQLTVKDVAQLLKVSENTVYRWLDDGDLPASKVNENYRLFIVHREGRRGERYRLLSPSPSCGVRYDRAEAVVVLIRKLSPAQSLLRPLR